MSTRTRDPDHVSAKKATDLRVEARIRAHVRQQMEERGITQNEVARRVDANQGHFSRILQGDRSITAGLAYRIAKGLGITPTRLLEEDPPVRFFQKDPHGPTSVNR